MYMNNGYGGEGREFVDVNTRFQMNEDRQGYRDQYTNEQFCGNVGSQHYQGYQPGGEYQNPEPVSHMHMTGYRDQRQQDSNYQYTNHSYQSDERQFSGNHSDDLNRYRGLDPQQMSHNHYYDPTRNPSHDEHMYFKHGEEHTGHSDLGEQMHGYQGYDSPQGHDYKFIGNEEHRQDSYKNRDVINKHRSGTPQMGMDHDTDPERISSYHDISPNPRNEHGNTSQMKYQRNNDMEMLVMANDHSKLTEGIENHAFDEYDTASITPPPIRRAISSQYRSVRLRRRGTGHQDHEETPKHDFADGMKTLAHRRRTLRMSKRSGTSMIGFERFQDYNSENDDRLPSNRNIMTKGLKQRMDILKQQNNVSLQEVADTFRTGNQNLSEEPSKLTGCAPGCWSALKEWVNSWLYQLELWAGAFKVIEGHFGTSTVSYFRFLRWLLFLNLFQSIFMIAAILLPFIFLPTTDPSPHADFVDSIDKCNSTWHAQAYYYSQEYTNRLNASENVGQQVLDVLQGTGWLANKSLFYGAYHNKTGYYPNKTTFTYNMSIVYLLTVGGCFLFSFLLLVKNSAKGMKQTVEATTGGNVSVYCNKVFGAWDFAITDKKAAELKHKNMLQEFMNDIEYQRLQWKKDSRTSKEKCKLFTVRFLINIFVLLILAGALAGIYFTNWFTQQELQKNDAEKQHKVVQLLVQYLPSITIMLLSVIVPMIFNKVVKAEDYMPAFTIRITLIRTVLLRLSSLGMLMISLYTNTINVKPSSNSTTIDVPCNRTAMNGSMSMTINITLNETQMCWETYVGQQIYKLVILNFIVDIVVTFLWEYPRKLAYTKLHDKIKLINLMGQDVFDLPKHVLDLVYLQTLCWLGLFFTPLIPAMCFITLFIFFYVKKGSLMHNCLPSQTYGTSKSNSLFMMVLLLSFFLTAAPITYMISKIRPSPGCGPFRVYSREDYIMFDAVTNMIGDWAKELKDIFFFIGKGSFLAIVFVLMCFCMYYFWIVGQANKEKAKKLREQLKSEGQDKQFLLARVNEALSSASC